MSGVTDKSQTLLFHHGKFWALGKCILRSVHLHPSV